MNKETHDKNGQLPIMNVNNDHKTDNNEIDHHTAALDVQMQTSALNVQRHLGLLEQGHQSTHQSITPSRMRPTVMAASQSVYGGVRGFGINTFGYLHQDESQYISATTNSNSQMTPYEISQPNQLEPQQYKNPMQYMSFTPAGIWCTICSKYFVVERWKHHYNTKHSNFSFGKQCNGFVTKLHTHVRSARNDPNRLTYAVDNKTSVVDYCMECCQIFPHKYNYTKHVKNVKNKCEKEMHQLVECYKLKCGRFYPTVGELGIRGREIVEISDQAKLYNENTLHSPNNMGRKEEGRIIGGSKPLFMNLFGTMPSNNQNKTASVDKVLQNVIGPNDKVREWRKIFHKRIATSSDYIEIVRKDLTYFHAATETINKHIGLSKLLDAFEMLENNFHSIVCGAQGNVRAALVKFKLDEGGDVDNPTKWGFRQRAEECTAQMEEFRPLLTYLYEHKCPILEEYLTKTTAPTYTVLNAHRDGLIGQLIYELGTEKVPDGDYIPWICRFAQSRCFKLEKERIRTRSIERCGSTFSTMLYIIREGVLACAAMMEHSGNGDSIERMTTYVQKSAVTNVISPWINVCRSKKSNEESTETSQYNEVGDIICKNVIFRRKIYTRLIPMISSSLMELYAILFDGIEWRHFLSCGGYQVRS